MLMVIAIIATALHCVTIDFSPQSNPGQAPANWTAQVYMGEDKLATYYVGLALCFVVGLGLLVWPSHKPPRLNHETTT